MNLVGNISSPHPFVPSRLDGEDISVPTKSGEDQKDRVEISDDKPQPAWTVLVYSSITPDIDAPGMEAIKELEKAGSDQNVTVALQLSRGPVATEGTWKGARRYFINDCSIKNRESNANTQPPENDLSSPPLQDLGRVDMADPQTLESFLKWGMERFPAEHTILVLGGHSAGFIGAITDDKRSRLMSLPDIQHTLQRVERETGRKPDILVFNSCVMSSIETVSQLDREVPFIVASEQKEMGAGMPLGGFIDAVQDREAAGKHISPEEAAALLVAESRKTPERVPVIAAVKSSSVTELMNAVDNLAGALIETSVPGAVIKDFIRATPQAVSQDREDPPLTDYRDLYDFCRQLATSPLVQDKTVRDAAEVVMKEMEETVISSGSQKTEENKDNSARFHGLSIYLPARNPGEFGDLVNSIIMGKYNDLEVAGKTRWLEFLTTLFDRN